MLWKNITRLTSVAILFIFIMKGIKMIFDSLGLLIGTVLLTYFGMVIYVEFLRNGTIGAVSASISVVLMTIVMYTLGFFNEPKGRSSR